MIPLGSLPLIPDLGTSTEGHMSKNLPAYPHHRHTHRAPSSADSNILSNIGVVALCFGALLVIGGEDGDVEIIGTPLVTLAIAVFAARAGFYIAQKLFTHPLIPPHAIALTVGDKMRAFAFRILLGVFFVGWVIALGWLLYERVPDTFSDADVIREYLLYCMGTALILAPVIILIGTGVLAGRTPEQVIETFLSAFPTQSIIIYVVAQIILTGVVLLMFPNNSNYGFKGMGMISTDSGKFGTFYHLSLVLSGFLGLMAIDSDYQTASVLMYLAVVLTFSRYPTVTSGIYYILAEFGVDFKKVRDHGPTTVSTWVKEKRDEIAQQLPYLEGPLGQVINKDQPQPNEPIIDVTPQEAIIPDSPQTAYDDPANLEREFIHTDPFVFLGIGEDYTREEALKIFKTKWASLRPDTGATHADRMRVSEAWSQIKEDRGWT